MSVFRASAFASSRACIRQTATTLGLAAVACVIPFLFGDYLLFQLTMVIVYAIAILGLNMLTGYSGQISVGHGAFFGIGAYVAAIAMTQWGLSYAVTPFLAGGVCLIAGYLFGLPALRLRGPYLALATFALAIAFPQLLKYKYLLRFTAGSEGITVEKPEVPFGLPIDQDQWLYYFCLAFAAVLFAGGRNLMRSRIGEALVSLREHPVAAEAMGVDIALYKTLTFAISAAYTGVAGALSAAVVQYVAPDSFDLFVSITLLVGVVIGGLATISGALYGAVFVEFIPNIADQISKAAPWAVYGVMLIACVLVMPSGIAGALPALRGRRAGPPTAGARPAWWRIWGAPSTRPVASPVHSAPSPPASPAWARTDPASAPSAAVRSRRS
jgi:branched-chain amino acid transport system permease protein